MSHLNPILTKASQATNDALESGANPFAVFRGRDEAYLAALLASVKKPVIEGVPFPTFPPPAMQQRIHGHSNETSIKEAFGFYRACAAQAQALGAPFREDMRMLDFGSGWGRIVRPFLPQFLLKNIVGYEPNPWFAQVARDCNPYVTFINGEYTPPALFADGTFDVFTSWSVFSHLPEALTQQWLAEFARMARPGALMYLTTWGDKFLETLAHSAKKRAAQEPIHWYESTVLDRLGDIASARETYAAGSYVWVRGTETYGECFIPDAALRRLLPPDLELAAADHTTLAQSLMVIRKRV